MILGIDIGGTAVKMGLLDREGNIHARHEASVCFDNYKTPILTTVVREAEKFTSASGETIEGIGVSATGQVDVRTGVVIGTDGKIPGYEGSPVKQTLEEAFDVPAWVLNDANAAVLGECAAGAGKGVDNVIMVTLGTGVGGGVVSDGKLLNGGRGIAGEIGHFTLYQNGPVCTCGKRGCYENYASSRALVKACIDATGRADLDGRMIFEAAEQRKQPYCDVLDRWLDDVAAGITGLVHIFNPGLVLVGGGVSTQEKLLIEPLRRRVLTGVMPRFSEGLRLERAALGNDAGMIGAVNYCLEQMKGNERHEV